jgi:hypothetical protein
MVLNLPIATRLETTNLPRLPQLSNDRAQYLTVFQHNYRQTPSAWECLQRDWVWFYLSLQI